MEDQTIGKQCEFNGCNQLDYLCFFCEICGKNFCKDHRHISVNCPNYLDTQSLSNPKVKTNHESIKCFFCSSSGPKFSSTKCNNCKEDFCLKHRLTFDHNCKSTFKIVTLNNIKDNTCSICKDNRSEVKPCNNCKAMLCLIHLGYLNHNCHSNKKSNMIESFHENKNKILNDLKAKKQLKTKVENGFLNIDTLHKDYTIIKPLAKGNMEIKEEERIYLRIVQNCQLNFSEIKGFPLHRYYDKSTLIGEVLKAIIDEFNLTDKYVIGEKNDIHMKNSFNVGKKLSEIASLRNGDTIMISKMI